MSIKIDKNKCIACKRCIQACPGNLLYHDQQGKCFIKYPKDCWGCTACLKECPSGAIMYFLGADIGGKDTYLYTKNEKEYLYWFVVKDDKEQHFTINKKQSNKY